MHELNFHIKLNIRHIHPFQLLLLLFVLLTAHRDLSQNTHGLYFVYNQKGTMTSVSLFFSCPLCCPFSQGHAKHRSCPRIPNLYLGNISCFLFPLVKFLLEACMALTKQAHALLAVGGISKTKAIRTEEILSLLWDSSSFLCVCM